MKRFYATVGLFALVGVAMQVAPMLAPEAVGEGSSHSVAGPEPSPTATPVPEAEAALIELVFVLDTTGSMAGLIEGAKETIWSIVNDFSSQQPRPEVRVGLVAYRDRGDVYVTESFLLTDDLDEVYAKLSQLQAEGGGDGPESVSRGLRDGVEAQPWTQDRERVYRSIFLVGDAPDKGYADEASLEQIVGLARGRDIYVNAIQCGSMEGVRQQFEAVARGGAGVFTAVAPDGAVERLESPMDGALERLERELSSTALSWGNVDEKQVTDSKIMRLEGTSTSSRASRLSVLSKRGGKVVTAKGKGDFLDDLSDGKVSLDTIEAGQLPDELEGLDAHAQQAEIAQRQAKREELQAQIDRLVGERDAWLAEERARRAASDDARYDREVVDSSLEKLRALGYIE